jgi:hypothetical protein
MAAVGEKDVLVLRFSAVKELFEYLDREINNNKKVLADLLREVEKVKVAADASAKLEEVLKELGGGAPPSAAAELDLDGVKVYINPSPRLELQVLVDAIRGMQQKILQLEKTRKSLEPLSKLEGLNATISVIFEDGNLKTIVVKL